MEEINYKEIIIDGLSFVFGIFLYALCFNLFLIPNDLVVSGFSGVAIVVERLFNINAQIFIYGANITMLVIGAFFLSKETTKRNILGSIMYPLMVTLTSPMALLLSKYLVTEDFYLTLLFAIILYGISSGLIYRSGFSTGGSDIIMQILNKYTKMGRSKSMISANTLIIIIGMIIFGLDKGVYSFIILICSTYFVDKIMFGSSDSKLFYIYTKRLRKVKSVIIKEFNTGLTCIPSKGGYSRKDGFMIMCVISNSDYNALRQRILEIDPDAFIVINKCFEVNGGVKRSKLPFM